MPDYKAVLTRIWHSVAAILGIDAQKGPLRAFVEIGAILGISFASTTAIAQPFYVPSGSMQPTLAIGDAFLATKYPYGYSRYSIPYASGTATGGRILQHMPKVGDVIVFRLPRNSHETLVKRVIGLPGDHIKMVGGHLWINDKELALKPDGHGLVEAEDGREIDVARFVETLPNGVTHRIFKWTWSGPLDDTKEFVVPAGHVFAMGDNRDNSLDSRVSVADGGVGYIPVENLVGRAEFVVGSFDFLNAHSLWAAVTEFRISRFFNSVD
jgi:signal peptidase I